MPSVVLALVSSVGSGYCESTRVRGLPAASSGVNRVPRPKPAANTALRLIKVRRLTDMRAPVGTDTTKRTQ
ncbi:hypothetical protein D3C76_1395900 [compost metagenome]